MRSCRQLPQSKQILEYPRYMQREAENRTADNQVDLTWLLQFLQLSLMEPKQCQGIDERGGTPEPLWSFCLDAKNAELEEGRGDGRGDVMPCFELPSWYLPDWWEEGAQHGHLFARWCSSCPMIISFRGSLPPREFAPSIACELKDIFQWNQCIPALTMLRHPITTLSIHALSSLQS